MSKIKKSNKQIFSEFSEKYKKHAFVLSDKKNRSSDKIFSKKLFVKIISKKLKIPTSKVRNYLLGKVPKKDEYRFKKITQKIRKYTTEKKNMYVSGKSFFPVVNKKRKLKRGEVYFFKTGLKLFFLNKEKKDNNLFEIPNFPISAYFNNTLKKSNKLFNQQIKNRLDEFYNLLFYSFNYFTIKILS